MPAAVEVTQNANQMLDGSDPQSQAVAREAVTGASSVMEAVDRVNLLDGMDDPIADEARAVLSSLPRAVDHAILAALRSALDSHIPITIEWAEGEVIGVRITETTDGAAHVVIVVVTPHGRTYVRK